MPVTRQRLLTHPDTRETLNLTDWAKKLNTHASTIHARLKKYDDLRIVLSSSRVDGTNDRWSKEEDELLKEAFKKVDPFKSYTAWAKKLNLKERTKNAIADRITTLRRKNQLPIKKGNLDFAIEIGALNVSQLSECLGVTHYVVDNYFRRGLRYTISPAKCKCISLHDFAKWAVNPVGSAMLAKTVDSNENAVKWTFQIIGKWLWVG